jgi:hypothetical protein
MKIRNGFVSNSSSSSFCIYGSEVDIDDIKIAAKTLGIEFDEDDPEIYELEEDISCQSGLEYYSICGEAYYFGRSYSTIKDDETGKQFKDSVIESFAKLGLGALILGECEEAWMDG